MSVLSEDKILVIYRYIGVISSILGIITFVYNFFLSPKNKVTSFQFGDIFQIVIIVFLIIFSIFLMSKEKRNKENKNKFLVFFAVIYSILSFLIYIISAFYFLIYEAGIYFNFIGIVSMFFIAFGTTYYMLLQINISIFFRYYSYLFLTSLFIVISFVFVRSIISEINQVDAIISVLYASLGVGLFVFLHDGSKKYNNNNNNNSNSNSNSNSKILGK